LLSLDALSEHAGVVETRRWMVWEGIEVEGIWVEILLVVVGMAQRFLLRCKPVVMEAHMSLHRYRCNPILRRGILHSLHQHTVHGNRAAGMVDLKEVKV